MRTEPDNSNIMRQKTRELSMMETDRLKAVKEQGQALWNMLDSCGASRELSLAKTKLEEAVMWAVKHITQ